MLHLDSFCCKTEMAECLLNILPVQIRGWKAWEQDTASDDYEFANGITYQKAIPLFSIV